MKPNYLIVLRFKLEAKILMEVVKLGFED